MLSMDVVLTFVVASTILCWVPGPDNLFVLMQSALHGRTIGLFATAGLCLGLIVHTLAVSMGVAAIFQTSELAFDLLKFVGAAYLIYLAVRSFMARPGAIGQDQSTQPYGQILLRGFLMNVTNPKVAIFFLAFLPQFTSPDAGNLALQMIALGGIFILCALVSFSLISVLSGWLSGWLTQSEERQLFLNRIAGVVFIALALKLVTSSR